MGRGWLGIETSGEGCLYALGAGQVSHGAWRTWVSGEFSGQDPPPTTILGKEESRAPEAAPGQPGGPEEEGPEVRLKMKSDRREGAR